jgi:crossover junction endodeoxyribonuclease RuvC
VVTGYGVIEEAGGHTPRLVAAGVVRTPAKQEFSLRLKTIYDGLEEVIAEFKPQEAAAEDIFTARNMRSALKLGQARGVALLAAAKAGLPVFAYPPNQVKKSLVGVGRASKEQVRTMVGALLKRPINLPMDASDALAVAITHLHARKLTIRGFK